MDEWHVNGSTGLGVATVNAALTRWVDTFDRERRGLGLRGPAASARYQQLMSDLIAWPVLEPARVGRALSSLLMWEEIDADGPIRTNLEHFILNDSRFGDPRLSQNAPKWQWVDNAARQKAVAWLSKQDLLFFFEFVIREDPHGRKKFWLQYIGQVDDAQVALCDEDVRRLSVTTRAQERLRYSRVVGTQDVSAFIMRFKGAGGLIFVEFSKSGNALYVHDAKVFAQAVGSIRKGTFHLTNDLKRASAVGKVAHHISTWRDRVSVMLSRLGIRRG